MYYFSQLLYLKKVTLLSLPYPTKPSHGAVRGQKSVLASLFRGFSNPQRLWRKNIFLNVIPFSSRDRISLYVSGRGDLERLNSGVGLRQFVRIEVFHFFGR